MTSSFGCISGVSHGGESVTHVVIAHLPHEEGAFIPISRRGVGIRDGKSLAQLSEQSSAI